MIQFTTESHANRFYEYMARAGFDYRDTLERAFIYVISCDLLANKLGYIYDLENRRNLYNEERVSVLSSSERQLIKVASSIYGLGAENTPTIGQLISNLDPDNLQVVSGALDIFVNRIKPLSTVEIDVAKQRGAENLRAYKERKAILDALEKDREYIPNMLVRCMIENLKDLGGDALAYLLRYGDSDYHAYTLASDISQEDIESNSFLDSGEFGDLYTLRECVEILAKQDHQRSIKVTRERRLADRERGLAK